MKREARRQLLQANRNDATRRTSITDMENLEETRPDYLMRAKKWRRDARVLLINANGLWCNRFRTLSSTATLGARGNARRINRDTLVLLTRTTNEDNMTL
jgi:hypothetical protein